MLANDSSVQAMLEAAVRDNVAAGIVASAFKGGERVKCWSAGVRSMDSAAPMNESTIFFIASMTKAVTALAAMQLVDRGRLSLDDEVAKYVAYFEDIKVLDGFDSRGQPILREPSRRVTVKDLLTHTSGLSYTNLNSKFQRYFEITEHPDIFSRKLIALEAPLMFDPGTRWEYGIGMDWVGQIIERIADTTLGEYMRIHIFEPLNMKDTGFSASMSGSDNVAGLHRRLSNGLLELIAPRSTASKREYDSGGGGLYSTVRDYTQFMSLFLDSRTDAMRDLISDDAVSAMVHNQIGALAVKPTLSNDNNVWNANTNGQYLLTDIPSKWGISWLINERETAEGRSIGSLAWAGYANTYYWIDREKQVAGTFFVQLLPFLDDRVKAAFRAYEKAIYANLREHH